MDLLQSTLTYVDWIELDLPLPLLQDLVDLSKLDKPFLPVPVLTVSITESQQDLFRTLPGVLIPFHTNKMPARALQRAKGTKIECIAASEEECQKLGRLAGQLIQRQRELDAVEFALDDG